MVCQSDPQTTIFSSYNGMNNFSCYFGNRDDVITPEILSDLKEFSENALKHFDEYNIPKLRAELLGYHIHNFFSFIEYDLRVDPKTDIKRFFPISIDCECPGRGIPSEELTIEQRWIKLNIITKIKREIDNFLRLVFFT